MHERRVTPRHVSRIVANDFLFLRGVAASGGVEVTQREWMG
jgi:hypothetical protein